uniref:RRM domain-containing protein n=1 Tax=Astatotilapia calliptera TaxID=8154 RepID=A0A3P8PAQ0_ASTCA
LPHFLSLAVNGKRKAETVIEDSPSKKAKRINDGFCLFVGNLNSSKNSEELKESLEKYLMSQNLLFKDIRLDQSRKHAFVDLLSEMDLTKALASNGEVLLDKPMKIAKAKIKTRDARCLFVKNLPYNITKEDILKVFHKAIAIRFPGGTEGPTQGIAFLEFKNTSIARKVQKQKQGVTIQKRVLILNCVGEKGACRVTKADVENKRKKGNKFNVDFACSDLLTDKKALQSSQNIEAGKKEAKEESCEKPEKAKVLSKTLIVMGLAEKTSPEMLKSVFEGAVNARVTVNKKDVSKRFGFVNFGSDESCKAAKEAMEDCELDGCKVTIAYAYPKGKKSRPGKEGRKLTGGRARTGGKT